MSDTSGLIRNISNGIRGHIAKGIGYEFDYKWFRVRCEYFHVSNDVLISLLQKIEKHGDEIKLLKKQIIHQMRKEIGSNK